MKHEYEDNGFPADSRDKRASGIEDTASNRVFVSREQSHARVVGFSSSA